MVDRAKKYIKLGDIFQVVLSQRFEAKLTKKPLDIYKKLRITNPSPFMFFFNFNDFQIIGASPEILLTKEKDIVQKIAQLESLLPFATQFDVLKTVTQQLITQLK